MIRALSAAVLSLGVAVQDIIFSVDEIPTRADKYRARGVRVVGGGCAATAAVAVARLGGRSLIATRLGGDDTGAAIARELQSFGVVCDHARSFAGRFSTVSAVFVDAAGERLVMSARDWSTPDDPEWLPPVADLGVAAVLADTRWPAGAERVLTQARALGLPAVLDAEAPVRPAEGAVRAASHVAFAAPGLRDWTGHGDLERGIVEVAGETGGFVCVTDGAAGVWWTQGGRVAHQPAFPVEVVDTLGAGDVWHGAFALALAEGADARRAIRFASAAAALKCTRPGGRAGVPDRAEVEAFLASAG